MEIILHAVDDAIYLDAAAFDQLRPTAEYVQTIQVAFFCKQATATAQG